MARKWRVSSIGHELRSSVPIGSHDFEVVSFTKGKAKRWQSRDPGAPPPNRARTPVRCSTNEIPVSRLLHPRMMWSSNEGKFSVALMLCGKKIATQANVRKILREIMISIDPKCTIIVHLSQITTRILRGHAPGISRG